MKIDYDRDSVGIGIVHLGVGAFHRAHQAVYTDAVLRQFGGNWGICGVSLRRPDVRDSLLDNAYAYSVAIRSSEGSELQHVGALRTVLVAPENPAAVIEQLAAASTHVVTLTITEKGYCLHAASGKLDLEHPDIAHDLEYLDQPRSAIGFIVAGLAVRRAANAGGLTLLSCDNLSANGRKLQAAVCEFAGELDPGLAEWVAQRCTFPCSMVDRIVPATTAEDIAAVAAEQNFEDQALVVTEPFSQWVIERNFAGPVPAWDQVGVNYVDDVAPFEEMKLRLLNASHSTIAYLGCLAGYSTVAQVIEDAAFASLVCQLMVAEMAPTLSELGGFDVEAYQAQLLQRFRNRSLQHFTRQIAMDGSQKIPQRLLPGIAHQLTLGASIDASLLGVAAWIRYTMGIDEQGQRFVVDDPLAAEFASLYQRFETDMDGYLDAMLQLQGVFPVQLADNESFRQRLRYWLGKLLDKGARQTVRAHWGGAARDKNIEEIA